MCRLCTQRRWLQLGLRATGYWLVMMIRVVDVVRMYRSNSNCLLNTPSGDTINITEHPGRRYSVDRQCQIIYGPESFYCAVSSSHYSIHSLLKLNECRVKVR